MYIFVFVLANALDEYASLTSKAVKVRRSQMDPRLEVTVERMLDKYVRILY